MSDSDRTCVHCNGPGTHQHNHTGVFLCCGHASWDIDAEPVRDEHDCVTWHTAERFNRDLECEIRDNPNPPTGDLIPCHEPAEWAITTSRFPGDPHDPDQPGAPTRTRYCYRHFGERFTEILENGDELDVRYSTETDRSGGDEA